MADAGPSTSPHNAHARVSTSDSESTASSRCSQCNGHPNESGRNLIVCIDGTSNQFGQNNTNVVKLLAKVDLESTNSGTQQYAYYLSGIGTRPKSMNVFKQVTTVISNALNMAVAWNAEDIVKDAYGWIARTYREGDQIYLFGFSRGAYQVRVLAGMIYEVGLLRTPTATLIATAYDHYDTIRSGKPKTGQVLREFKRTFSWKSLRVHFVGVWDTVSSVGFIRGDILLSRSSTALHACHFRHALALDELRVKFMPEYFHEMHSQTDDERPDYIVTSPEVEHATSPMSDNGADLSEGKKKKKPSNIKEVWFPGSHSDVGGTNTPGKAHQAGNVSLLWMRREAAANGLVLHPTDIVWVPDDLDLGITNSMKPIWRVIEYMPIKHQVAFSGAGENDRRTWHRLQPRRIIPGQKVHASVLYAHGYKPQAKLGEGFDIPIIHSGLEDTELDDQIWETGLFDDSAAQELVTHLGRQQRLAPIYLDRLLFMLRFKEGKQRFRSIPNWKEQFMKLIHDRYCTPLVRLVAIVAYYEASCDPEAHHIELTPEIFDVAKNDMRDILAATKHRDHLRVVALLRPLTKHQILRELILTQEVFEAFINLLDSIVERLHQRNSWLPDEVRQTRRNFQQAMDGLNCLLQCEDTRQTLVDKLGAYPPNSVNLKSRLSQILDVKDSHLQTSALRMVWTLARIQEARALCSEVKPAIRKLARKDEQRISLLAVEILLFLYNADDPNQLNIRDGMHSTDEQGRGEDHAKQILRRLFGLDAPELDERQRGLIRELKKAVQKGDARERTAATMTLLKLCETTTIRTYICEINLLEVFIGQLRRKDSALLAAYALATCLRCYSDMKESIKDDEDLPKHIVGMLLLDYFDDAVGSVEGFQIFKDFMQHDDLRKKIIENRNARITGVLYKKLRNGDLKEIRMSLISWEIFRSFDQDGLWTEELVNTSLEHLRNPTWKVQKAGVTILSALAQTELGEAAIMPRVKEIVAMLLPSPPTSPSEVQTHPPHKSLSWMLGPACALRSMAQNKTLRDQMRDTEEYASLKHLYLSGMLVNEKDLLAWRVNTPNRADVMNMLDKMITAVDGELTEEELPSIGDAVPPHIEHWNHLPHIQAVGAITGLSALLGVSALVVLTWVVFTPTNVYGSFKRRRSRNQGTHILPSFRNGATHDFDRHQTEIDPDSHEGGSAPGGHSGDGPSGGHGGEGSQGVEMMHALDGGDMQSTTNITN